MSGYRKRRSSDSLEGDNKRISLGYGSYIKQEPNPHVTNNGRQNSVAVPYSYIAPVAPVGIQSAIVYNKPYYSSQYVDQYNLDKMNANSSNRNYNSGYGVAATSYDNSRHRNFKHEVYINSLRQSERRYVNFINLQRHLSDIDIRNFNRWSFSTALDLTLELESSLKYFVDTRNEIVFLRKVQHQQCMPFSYNDINITNRNGLYNRMRFLDNESAYRSNRMNLLFHQLQSVVIPSIIDDIRYVHSVSYEKSWTSRARYWFNQFKQIQWNKSSHQFVHRRANKGRHPKTHRPHRSRNIKEEDVRSKVIIKSEVIAKPKAPSFDERIVKIEKVQQVQLKDTTLREDQSVQSVKGIPTMSNIVEKTLESGYDNNNLVLGVLDKNLEAEIIASNKDTIDVAAAKEGDISNSIVIIEPDISLVNVTDDENHDLSNSANPTEGDVNN